MNEIRALLGLARRRLEAGSFLHALHAAMIAAACLALVLIIADRSAAEAFVPWTWVGPALALIAIGAAAIIWSRRRTTEHRVALLVDERLDLREKLSTALHCHGRDDAFARAAVEDAVVAARDPRNHERIARHFRLQSPRGWWISPLLVLAAIMVSFLSFHDLFARDAANDPAVTEAKLEAKTSVEAVVKQIQQSPMLSKELGDLGELSKEGTDPNALKQPEAAKRDAIKKITDLNKKLDDILSGEKGKTVENLEKALSQLRTEEGPAKELSEALAKGDFQAAQDALKQMMDKLQAGQMSEEDKQKLAEQLQKMAEQLEKLAQQQQQLENALKQAGLDPNLAGNPQALQQAIQNAQNLNDQQKQQLQQLAAAQQAAAQMCQGLGQACQQMAQCVGGGQMGQVGQAGQGMAGQLSQMEAMQQLLMEAQAAAGACQGQCNGLGRGLTMQQALAQWTQGGAFGGPGIGRGGKAPIAPTPSGTKAEKANVNTVEGDVIAKMLFDGPQVRGESQAKLASVVEEARRGFDEALAEDQLPRMYHEAHQHYFGELEKLTKAIREEGKRDPAPSAPANGGAAGSGQ